MVRVPKSVHVNRTIAALGLALTVGYLVTGSVDAFLVTAALLYLPSVAALGYLLTLTMGYRLEAAPSGMSRELGE